MKHQAQRYKLGRGTNHRASLWYNLVRSLVLHGKIVTTYAKAKSIVPLASKLVALAKEENLNNYRAVLAQMRGDAIAARKIFEYGKLFAKRPGGYVSIVKMGQRKGDSAQQACIMFVEDVA